MKMNHNQQVVPISGFQFEVAMIWIAVSLTFFLSFDQAEERIPIHTFYRLPKHELWTKCDMIHETLLSEV